MKGVIVLCFLLTFGLAVSQEFKSCGNVPSGVFIPNRANCNYFFLCVNGYLMQLTCELYTVFDPINRICSADCNAPVTPSPGPTTPTIPTAPTLPGPTPTTPAPTYTSCTNAPTGYYVAIPGTCNMYYCWNGQGLFTQCPDGSCFDQPAQSCK